MTTVHTVKSKVNILQNFEAFTEYVNFTIPVIQQITLKIQGVYMQTWLDNFGLFATHLKAPAAAAAEKGNLGSMKW